MIFGVDLISLEILRALIVGLTCLDVTSSSLSQISNVQLNQSSCLAHSQSYSFTLKEASMLKLSANDRERLITEIWKRESNGQVEGLTFWSKTESFASVGFNHSLWYTHAMGSTINRFVEFAFLIIDITLIIPLLRTLIF